MTSGIGFGGLGSAVPTYAQALETQIKTEPGARFTYSGISYQVFGAVLERKLAGRKQTPHEYLHERLLDPIGVHIAAWRSLKDGTQPLPTGASLTPAQWAKYGLFLMRAHDRFAACFAGTPANPHYGLGVWLRPVDDPPDVVYASGSGGQALYIVPSERTVIVHFGKSASYRHEAFLRRLFKRVNV